MLNKNSDISKKNQLKNWILVKYKNFVLTNKKFFFATQINSLTNEIFMLINVKRKHGQYLQEIPNSLNIKKMWLNIKKKFWPKRRESSNNGRANYLPINDNEKY